MGAAIGGASTVSRTVVTIMAIFHVIPFFADAMERAMAHPKHPDTIKVRAAQWSGITLHNRRIKTTDTNAASSPMIPARTIGANVVMVAEADKRIAVIKQTRLKPGNGPVSHNQVSPKQQVLGED